MSPVEGGVKEQEQVKKCAVKNVVFVYNQHLLFTAGFSCKADKCIHPFSSAYSFHKQTQKCVHCVVALCCCRGSARSCFRAQRPALCRLSPLSLMSLI